MKDDSWKTTSPPHANVVEVESEGKIIRVLAIWGSDGTLPHWESEDHDSAWPPTAFKRWRKVQNEG